MGTFDHDCQRETKEPRLCCSQKCEWTHRIPGAAGLLQRPRLNSIRSEIWICDPFVATVRVKRDNGDWKMET